MRFEKRAESSHGNGYPSETGNRGLRRESCLLCGHTDFSMIHHRAPWSYIKCRKCGLVAIAPKPDIRKSISSYAGYLPEEPGEIAQWAWMMKPVIRESARIIGSQFSPKPGKLLDVGCGFGFFLREMRGRGWDVEGVEISHTGRDYAGNKWNLPVRMGPIEDLGLPDHTFDVVTLFYVIEHVLDPIGLMKEILRILKPGGMILVRWPHTTPIVMALGRFAHRFDLYHTPYHIHDFSPRTIKRLLLSCGFISCRTLIGGHTRLQGKLARPASMTTGNLARALFRLSGGKLLLPGVSKTTLAFKEES